MIPHVALGAETFAAALGAREWAFVLVDPRVDLEVLLLAESLSAVGEEAAEGLGSVVQVQVRT